MHAKILQQPALLGFHPCSPSDLLSQARTLTKSTTVNPCVCCVLQTFQPVWKLQALAASKQASVQLVERQKHCKIKAEKNMQDYIKAVSYQAEKVSFICHAYKFLFLSD